MGRAALIKGCWRCSSKHYSTLPQPLFPFQSLVALIKVASLYSCLKICFSPLNVLLNQDKKLKVLPVIFWFPPPNSLYLLLYLLAGMNPFPGVFCNLVGNEPIFKSWLAHFVISLLELGMTVFHVTLGSAIPIWLHSVVLFFRHWWWKWILSLPGLSNSWHFMGS